ncbi:MAG: porin family protein [Prevotella sp.]|nr:porin family protein [Prevotella sp.]
MSALIFPCWRLFGGGNLLGFLSQLAYNSEILSKFAPSNKTSNMKSTLLSRFFIGSALLAFPIFGHAQDGSKSKWTITPRVGMTLSTITNGNSNIEAYESRIGFGGGVEAEFHFNRMLGLSFGAFYTMQGAKVNAEMIMATNALSADGIHSVDDMGFNHTAIGKNAHFNIFDYTNDYNYIERIHNIKDALGYVNIPLMLNVHLPFNLPVGITAKAGAQMDVLVSAKAKSDDQIYYDGSYTNRSYSQDIKHEIKDFGLTIPAGLAVSYKNIEFDARYLWNVTDINDIDGNSQHPNKNRNSTFLLTLGYNFNL